MSSYEIHLRKRITDPEAVYRVRRGSDFAAIRNAQKMAGNEGAYEVWKGGECIYAHKGTARPLAR